MNFSKNNTYIFIILVLCLFYWLINSIFVANIDSLSMFPTLKKGNKIVTISNVSFHIDKDDIILFKKDKNTFIKRCVALPKDSIFYFNANYYLRLSKEKRKKATKIVIPFKNLTISSDLIWLYKPIIERTEKKTLTRNKTDLFLNNNNIKEYKFSDDYYFAIGDNYANSNDSRSFGPISRKSIVGKMLFKLW